MPHSRIFLLLPLILLTLACNRNQIDPQASSQICPNVNGPEAIYWDIRNGMARGDIPGGVPTLDNPGGSFSHPNFPLLGFTYPVGWQPTALTDNTIGHTVGVNLIRQDNQAVYRFFSTTLNGLVPVLDVTALEINNMLAFLGNPNIDQVVCTNSVTDNSLGNIVQQNETRLIRAGAFTIQVNVTVTYVDGLQNTFVSNHLTVGPTAEHQNLITEVFLPLHWQLLLRPPEDDLNRDTDKDGVWDINDKFPNDPTKW